MTNKKSDVISNRVGDSLKIYLERLWAPVLFVVLTALSLWWMKYMTDAPRGLELVLYKATLVNTGFIVAHIIRKLAFPYINFNIEKEWSNNVMVIALYVTIIYCFAMGG